MDAPQLPEIPWIEGLVQRYLGEDLLELSLQQQGLSQLYRNRCPFLAQFDGAAQFFLGGRPVAGGNRSAPEQQATTDVFRLVQQDVLGIDNRGPMVACLERLLATRQAIFVVHRETAAGEDDGEQKTRNGVNNCCGYCVGNSGRLHHPSLG